MNLLAVERIKLFTTRSPWWCALITLAITIGFAALLTGTSSAADPIDLSMVQYGGVNFGIAVVMVLATLAVTTEYRFNTIKTTFQAVPRRTPALIAKAGVVATVALVIGEIAAFGAWAVAKAIRPEAHIALSTAQDWYAVAGLGVVFAFAAVIAVAVGILVRHSAGAIAILLIYSLLVEKLIQIIPKVGRHIHDWMPFNVAGKFLNGGGGVEPSSSPLSPGWALAYFAGVAIVLLAIAIGVAKKRDA
jgi:ABC-2 type transport system permease protein